MAACLRTISCATDRRYPRLQPSGLPVRYATACNRTFGVHACVVPHTVDRVTYPRIRFAVADLPKLQRHAGPSLLPLFHYKLAL